jgi:hypothetical protein
MFMRHRDGSFGSNYGRNALIKDLRLEAALISLMVDKENKFALGA